MTRDYFCANCQAAVDIDQHGRCEHCGSDSIDIAVRPCVTVEGLASAFPEALLIDLEVYDEERYAELYLSEGHTVDCEGGR